MDVLVIEDDAAIRTLVRAALEKNGGTVQQAQTASEGEELAYNKEFDAII